MVSPTQCYLSFLCPYYSNIKKKKVSLLVVFILFISSLVFVELTPLPMESDHNKGINKRFYLYSDLSLLCLQPICCDQSVPAGHDSSDPHSLCPGTVPARTAG